MKFNIYNLIVEVPGMQLPLDKGVGGIYSRKAHLSAAADKLFAAWRLCAQNIFFTLAKKY
jgi:hypothetical protein